MIKNEHINNNNHLAETENEAKDKCFEELTKRMAANEKNSKNNNNGRKNKANAIWATRGYRLLLRFVVIKIIYAHDENSRQQPTTARILFLSLFPIHLSCSLARSLDYFETLVRDNDFGIGALILAFLW